jgi:hypothetical protein
MSEQDFQRGREGQGWASGINYNDWKAGQQDRERSTPQAILPTGPTLGIGALPLLFATPVMYPIAGVGAVAGLLATALLMDTIKAHGALFFLATLAGALGGFFATIRFEGWPRGRCSIGPSAPCGGSAR